MLFKEGEKMSNPALANTLQKIADHGADVFYTGPIADSLVKAVSNTMILLEHYIHSIHKYHNIVI